MQVTYWLYPYTIAIHHEGWDLTLPSKLVRAVARARFYGLVSDFVGGYSRVFMVTPLKTRLGKKGI